MSNVYFGFSVLSIDSKSRLPCEGSSGFAERLLDHVDDVDIPNACRPGGIENNVNMFVEPISEEGIRNADIKSSAFPADELRGFEPGVVALLVYFFFDFIQNFLPGIHETANM